MNVAPLTAPVVARRLSHVAALLLALALLTPGVARAQAADAGPPLTTPAPPAAQQKSPALDLSSPQPAPRPVTKQWWFWTAVGTVVVATAVVLVLANRKDGPPTTTLGNQEFTP